MEFTSSPFQGSKNLCTKRGLNMYLSLEMPGLFH